MVDNDEKSMNPEEHAVIKQKTVLLLDMNSTFMFGEDRFGNDQDFSIHYRKIGGTLPDDDINRIIRETYQYLDTIYPDEKYRCCFPGVGETIVNTCENKPEADELEKIIQTFAFHERGHIPTHYVTALKELSEYFTLALVIDIWAPKQSWLEVFKDTGVSTLFAAASYSSDHGMVKPSPKPFERVIDKLAVDRKDALVVGDSVRRDLGGAIAADIDCVLVGGATHNMAVGSFLNLLEFTKYCRETFKDTAEV